MTSADLERSKTASSCGRRHRAGRGIKNSNVSVLTVVRTGAADPSKPSLRKALKGYAER
jgi:hypothetical protein